jgi:hypothetical protein
MLARPAARSNLSKILEFRSQVAAFHHFSFARHVTQTAFM